MKPWISAALATWALLATKPVEAHGFGQRYDLPIPLSYYLVGSGLVVGLSFVLLIATARRSAGRGRAVWHREIDLSRLPRWLTGSMLALVRTIGLAALLLVMVAGLFGDQSPIRNIAPSLVWIVTWVGLAFFCALCVNAWLFLNPWHTLFVWGSRLLDAVGPARTPQSRFHYPDWLGAWPAVLFLWCFAWAELAWGGGETPANLAWLALIYSGITLSGMAAYGPSIWLERAEFFTIFFGYMGRFAPLGLSRGAEPETARADATVLSREATGHVLVLRPFGGGLTPTSARPVSASAFIVLMLSTVTFDGLMETPLWAATQDAILSTEFLAPALFALRDLFGDVRDGLETVALLVFPALAFAIFYAINALMRQVSRRRSPVATTPISSIELVGWFATSLLPIAIGYHFAHYLSFLLIAGQLSIPLASDPLGYGWDLFGTGGYRIDIGVINARITWYVALVSIVLGHMIAVVLAHITAIRVFKDRKLAATSELPMIALMIGYTSLSLWILAQPIVD
jgi:hypothetical protein